MRLKTALWLEDATAVSACDRSTRSVSEVRKKGTDLEDCTQSQCRGIDLKLGEGNGQPPWFTETVLDVLGDDTTLVNGIEGECNPYNIP